mgnify:FL=1
MVVSRLTRLRWGCQASSGGIGLATRGAAKELLTEVMQGGFGGKSARFRLGAGRAESEWQRDLWPVFGL